MSHFSKIKTNISDEKILVKTLKQMGFNYEYFSDSSTNMNDLISMSNIIIHDNSYQKKHLFSFVWTNNQYNLVADLQMWNLDVNFDYFLDLLSQKYAYNVILNQSFINGFTTINEKILEDGSIKIVLKRWSTHSC
uniref:Uncharacterized protein ycf35 n=1 Tax=Chondria sp. (in: red algae) TaxID=1982705 RepID=A0A1Z1ME08_9FLOR|nr:hypothetical protein [Chondria sp. (in: red algae)]